MLDKEAIRPLIHDRLVDLQRQKVLADTNRHFYMSCARLNPCIVSSNAHGNDPGIYLGSATAEQPMCGRRPQPYYCVLPRGGALPTLEPAGAARSIDQVFTERAKLLRLHRWLSLTST